MNEIQMWRENAMMSRKEMYAKMEIPVRTIEDWESGKRNPPSYVKRFVINELMDITERLFEERARKRIDKLKSDDNGNRPAGSWAVISSNGNDEFIELFPNMKKAMDSAGKNDEVAYIICNVTDSGLSPWYEDKNGDICSDYDYLSFEH